MPSEQARYEPIARKAAQAAGIDDNLFVRQISQESGWLSEVVHCQRDSSAGARGVAQIVPQFHPTVDPCDPIAALEYAAGLMRSHLAVHNGDWALALSSYNAGPGATQQGLAGTLPGWPYAETVRYVANILEISQEEARLRLTGQGGGPRPPAIIPFIPDAPVDTQPNGWGCALESVQWLLRSIGRAPDANDTRDDPWLRSQLVPGIISEQNGLEDASGRQLAAWLTREYGTEMGFTAHAADVSFDDVLAGAGVNPTMIGGRRWGPGGHWSGVRRADEHGWLELANPAPGWTGVGTHLDRTEWAARGPWSAIFIDRAAMLGQPAPVPPAPPVPVPPPADTRLERAVSKARELLAILEAPS
jgi:hypothetical protein